ncbi:DMSO/TMAO reductase YedYZ molybdopterin-dependent catalytic subunit [Motilibacter peucedani]|uniref:DMSO/TMAO reductase YedYZ molybdopterin-dependent catalytic subunit n=1 Tax=Motilibacter peucedani TaxID=598650 RepID=A0A420XLA2_9ACTN|nr:molybdopterin-dependent oxidoreductase [Motilibacter peucedani]RKS69323.1 DMSO/TMAO reductase YedYZ molybdopterin-dependent catalytic subunit [Motilibacter peucedani]
MKNKLLGALAGLLSALLALGAAELVAALLDRPSSPVVSVGGAFVDRTPRWLKEFAIRHFGENDKDVLLTGVVATVLVLSLALGALAVRHLRVAVGVVVAVGVGAALVALTRPTASGVDVLPSLAAGAVGAAGLAALVRSTPRAAEDGSRRTFLLAAGGTAVLAAGTGGLGRLVFGRHDVASSRAAVVLPPPLSPAPAAPAGYTLGVPGITPFYTSPRDFYRVDTALVVPQLSTDEWRLRVHGEVEEPFTLEWRDLLALPMMERDITLTCVSNEVGGKLAGTARWQGVPVRSLLDRAKPRKGADQVVTRSVDGMTIGTPTAALLDGRDAMLAVSMNGAPLRPEHGFPVRMVVPGLYGYVSATKWLVDMEVTTFDAYDPYWVKRGWDARAAIKTASRIDTPKPLSTSRPGTVAVGGVAWAQERGISKVEVRVDGGQWQQARLSAPVGKDTWRQWSWDWQVDAVGNHKLEVRATDGTGAVQPQDRTAPFPGGSQGWHSILVQIGR